MKFSHVVSRLGTTMLMAAMMVGSGTSDAEAKRKFVTLGTAGVTGVYYPVGGTLCRLVNLDKNTHNIRCTVESTGGSIYNLNAVRQNELDVAFAQSDWHYNAVNGTGVFADQGKNEDLRSLYSLHSEAFTIVSRADKNIETLDDLKGKRVSIGNPGSGMRATMDKVMEAKGWTKDVFSRVAEFKASEQAQKLCDNQIDAFVFATGHPNGSIQEVTSTCDTQIVKADDEAIKSLIEKYSYYAPATIPGGMYTGNDEDIQTFGVKATVVSSTHTDEDLIYNVVKSLFHTDAEKDIDRLKAFKSTHPILATLNKEDMLKDGLTAPLHPGAKRYYIEAGMLKE